MVLFSFESELLDCFSKFMFTAKVIGFFKRRFKMDKVELARENHLFLVAQVPNCMFGEGFQAALSSAYVLMKEIIADDRGLTQNDFCHCGFETGYVGITALAAKVIRDEDIDLFKLASALHLAFGPNKDTGEVNDRVAVYVQGNYFTFSITDYETNDPKKGWISCTEDPLSVPFGQTMHRRVIIGLAQ